MKDCAENLVVPHRHSLVSFHRHICLRMSFCDYVHCYYHYVHCYHSIHYVHFVVVVLAVVDCLDLVHIHHPQNSEKHNNIKLMVFS